MQDDDALVQKFCTSLANVLGDTPLENDSAWDILASIAPMLWFEKGGRKDGRSRSNRIESHVNVLRNSSLSVKGDPLARVC